VYHCRHFGAKLPDNRNVAWRPDQCSLPPRRGSRSNDHTPQQVFQYRRSGADTCCPMEGGTEGLLRQKLPAVQFWGGRCRYGRSRTNHHATTRMQTACGSAQSKNNHRNQAAKIYARCSRHQALSASISDATSSADSARILLKVSSSMAISISTSMPLRPMPDNCPSGDSTGES
jgi:hypothetical protein